MNTETMLETFGKVAGIGGIALGVFLLLFRDLIRKSIFSKLTKEQSFRLLRLIAFFVWTIAILGLIAWVADSFLLRSANSKVPTEAIASSSAAKRIDHHTLITGTGVSTNEAPVHAHSPRLDTRLRSLDLLTGISKVEKSSLLGTHAYSPDLHSEFKMMRGITLSFLNSPNSSDAAEICLSSRDVWRYFDIKSNPDLIRTDLDGSSLAVYNNVSTLFGLSVAALDQHSNIAGASEFAQSIQRRLDLIELIKTNGLHSLTERQRFMANEL